MSGLPEKGEALAAAEAMNERMRASTGELAEGATVNVGEATFDLRSGEAAELPFAVRAVYSDLFDVGEVVQTAAGLVEVFILDIASDRRDPVSAMVSMYLLAVGQGVLIERGRWGK